MLIYHITNNQLVCTQVVMGFTTQVSHFNKKLEDVPAIHLDSVKELRNGGKVYVTGATYATSKYEGRFEDRQAFEHYLNK